MLRGTGAVAGATLRLWVREIARLFGVPVRRVVAAAIGAGATTVALGAMLAVVATVDLDAALPAELAEPILGSAFGGAVLTGGGIAVALSAAAPPRTALQNLLDLLPVGRAAARLGQLLPVLVTGLAFSLAMSSTGIVVVLRSAPGPGRAVLGVGAFVLLVASALLIAMAGHALLDAFAARFVRLPGPYATTVAGAVTFGLVLAVTAPDLLLPHRPAAPGSPPEVLPHRAFAAALVGPSPLAWLVALCWVLVAVGVTLAAARVHRVAGAPRRSVLPRGTRPLRRTPGWGLLWTEILLGLRSPQFVIVALAVPAAVAGVVALSAQPLAAPVVPSLAAGVIALPGVVALSSAGRTLPVLWIPALVTARPASWILPKLAAAAALSFLLSAAAATALLGLGVLDPGTAVTAGARAALLVALALACGALVPVGEQQPLSATLAGLLLAMLSVLVGLVLAVLEPAIGPGSAIPITLAATAGALAVYATVGARHAMRDAVV